MPPKPSQKLPIVERMWHPWHTWECFKSGFYATAPTEFDGVVGYTEFLGNIPRFQRGLRRVVREWPYTCEHHLTNNTLNRIAWLGQAAACIEEGLPSCCRRGFSLLPKAAQIQANYVARQSLKQWLQDRPKNEDPNIQKLGSATQVNKIERYINVWESRGYQEGIPDIVPNVLLRLRKAPSYKAICLAILTNDVQFHSLGFSPNVSSYYSALKKVEIEERVLNEKGLP